MKTFKKVTLAIAATLIAIAALLGFATMGLIFLGIAFTGSIIAVAYAAWQNRDSITSRYKVVG